MGTRSIVLQDIAYARSGDKGASANVGLLAYSEAGYDFLKEHMTAERVEAFFKPLGVRAVKRFELPNLMAFNFLLVDILAGGGSRSVRIDAQGKSLGQALLQMPLEIDDDAFAACKNPKE